MSSENPVRQRKLTKNYLERINEKREFLDFMRVTKQFLSKLSSKDYQRIEVKQLAINLVPKITFLLYKIH